MQARRGFFVSSGNGALEVSVDQDTGEDPPTGMGEIGVVTVAPAIANAIFQLTGTRLRHLPMSPERVKAALKA
jgi:CO/xanthine dehydrogenase Mo-binding subunit